MTPSEAQNAFLCSTAQTCIVRGTGEQENNSQHILNRDFSSTLKGKYIYIVCYIVL